MVDLLSFIGSTLVEDLSSLGTVKFCSSSSILFISSTISDNPWSSVSSPSNLNLFSPSPWFSSASASAAGFACISANSAFNSLRLFSLAVLSSWVSSWLSKTSSENLISSISSASSFVTSASAAGFACISANSAFNSLRLFSLAVLSSWVSSWLSKTSSENLISSISSASDAGASSVFTFSYSALSLTWRAFICSSTSFILLSISSFNGPSKPSLWAFKFCLWVSRSAASSTLSGIIIVPFVFNSAACILYTSAYVFAACSLVKDPSFTNSFNGFSKSFTFLAKVLTNCDLSKPDINLTVPKVVVTPSVINTVS